MYSIILVHCLTCHTILYQQTHFGTTMCHPQCILYFQSIIHTPEDHNFTRFCHDYPKRCSRTVPDENNLWSLSLCNLFYCMMSSSLDTNIFPFSPVLHSTHVNSSLCFLVTSQWRHILSNGHSFLRAVDCIIAVKKDWGLKNPASHTVAGSCNQ